MPPRKIKRKKSLSTTTNASVAPAIDHHELPQVEIGTDDYEPITTQILDQVQVSNSNLAQIDSEPDNCHVNEDVEPVSVEENKMDLQEIENVDEEKSQFETVSVSVPGINYKVFIFS